jgi:hypothetical protein
MKTVSACALAALLAAGAAGAADSPAPAPCADAKSHEFDFWLGSWEVRLREGTKIVGFNRITPVLDGCVLQETWRGVSGSAGTSLNFYDTQRKRWRQLWVWREGTTLELEGEFSDGRMVLAGESVEPDGRRVQNRITWFDEPGDTVRQLWEISRDGGATWKVEFDGLYRKAD